MFETDSRERFNRLWNHELDKEKKGLNSKQKKKIKRKRKDSGSERKKM